MRRRDFLAAAGLFLSSIPGTSSVLQAAWRENAFAADTIDKALKNTLGTDNLVATDKIAIVAPPVASDSSSVDVEIISGISCEALYLFVANNFTPLAFMCTLSGKALPNFSARIKMKESSDLVAVVRQGQSYYKATAHVDVTAQAC
jgi:sulfur-oxidizing protein SoxY